MDSPSEPGIAFLNFLIISLLTECGQAYVIQFTPENIVSKQ